MIGIRAVLAKRSGERLKKVARRSKERKENAPNSDKLRERVKATLAAETVLPPYRIQNKSRRRTFILFCSLIFACFIYGFGWALTAPYLIVPFTAPLIILCGLMVWALPDMDRAPTKLLETLYFAFLIALIMWPNYLAISLPGLPWITVIRLIGFPMAITFLVCISISEEFRRRLATALKDGPAPARLMIIFAAIQVLTIVVSKSPFDSLQKTFAAQVNWTAIFFIGCYVALRPGNVRRWAAIFCMMALPICLIALREKQKDLLPWAGHIPSFLQIEDESVARILSGAHRDGGEYRVQSTFSTPLGLAEYLALVLPFLLHYLATHGGIIFRLLVVALIIVILDVILLTDSRLGLIGGILSLLAYVFAWGFLRWRARRESIVAPAIVLGYPAFAVAALGATLVIGRIRERIFGSGQYDASTEGRKLMYQEGIPKILTHPWGFGAGMGASTLGITNPSGTLTIDTYYIAIGLEYGVIGFLVYYGLIILVSYRTSRAALEAKFSSGDYSYFLPLAIALLNYLLIKSVFSNEDNHPLAFMMMGMCVGLCHRFNTDRRKEADTTQAMDEVTPTPPRPRPVDALSHS